MGIKELILQHLKDHPDRHIDGTDLATELELPVAAVYSTIYEMESKGEIEVKDYSGLYGLRRWYGPKEIN